MEENVITVEVLEEIVMKLVGPINPIGCSQRDSERLQNVKTLGGLVYNLFNKLTDIPYYNKNSHEGSGISIVKESKHQAGMLDDYFMDIFAEKGYNMTLDEEVFLITQEGKYLKTYNEFGHIEETSANDEAQMFSCGDSDVNLVKDVHGWVWKDEPLLALNKDDYETYCTIVNQRSGSND